MAANLNTILSCFMSSKIKLKPLSKFEVFKSSLTDEEV